MHYRCVYEYITIIKNKKFMKQKLLNLCLLAVMMIVGSSGAWGTETSLSPSLLITVNSSGTVVSTGDSWAINQTGLSGNNLFKNSGPVALIKFDASTTLSGKSLQAATLTFDITAGAYNSSMNLYSISLTDWTADNATWSTNYGPTAITIATDWSTKNNTTGFSILFRAKIGGSFYCKPPLNIV